MVQHDAGHGRSAKDAPPLRIVGDDERTPNLPAVRTPAEPDAPLEGTVVPRGKAVRPRVIAGRAVHVITDVATHQRTRTAARHVGYVAVGAHAAAKKVFRSRTADYDAWMVANRATGDQDHALEWEARRTAYLKDRDKRWNDRVELAAKILGKLHWILGGIFVFLLVIGVFLAIGEHRPEAIRDPFYAIAGTVRFIVIVATVSWLWTLAVATTLGVLALWNAGRTATAAGTGWVLGDRADKEDAGLVVTADGIVLALQHLPIPAIKKAMKDGWIPVFHQPPRKDGRGYWVVVGLPLGVTAEMVADQRPILARNLNRAEIETWPSDAEKNGTGPPGYLDLWIADPGALSKPAPEYPLLHEGAADVFEGVPAGVSPRGDAIMVPIVSNNAVAGGQMGQGKSNACRVVLLGCALDPLCVIDAFVFANNGDFDAYRPRLNIYRRGIDDETAYAALQRLRWYYEEVGRREGRLAELGAKKVTRRLAEQHPDLRPIVGLMSECHELFDHAEFGEEAGELATKTAKRARKTAITLVFDTQSSRKEAIPPKLVELVSVNICFYVKTWRSNDGFLGDGCFQAGIRATELRPGRDRGTSLIIGVSDAPFELLKWYFVAVDDDTGWDAATDVIARAVANMAPGTPTGDRLPEVEPEQRDLLDDLDEVMPGRERVRLADLPARLRELAPHWEPYRRTKGTDLERDLNAARVRVLKPKNVAQLDPKDLREALARRAAESADEDG